MQDLGELSNVPYMGIERRTVFVNEWKLFFLISPFGRELFAMS